MSRSALYRLFAPAGGVAQYVKGRRLLAARAALTRAGRSERVSAIGYRFGFGDAATFSRAFRQAFGVSPSEIAAVSHHLVDPGETDIFAEWIRAMTP